uniref:EOG090X0G12 n=1 Tax=Eubosmina coregoni TaxID=186181 RepID=A0A4Y7LLR8_9CRUS|nr:EOG090X0G12 [Eubosmina coregoni]
MILQDKDYLCHLSLPNYPSCTGCTIDVSWDLQIIFKKMSSKVCDFQQCSSIKEIVKEITSIIEEYQKTHAVYLRKDQTGAADYLGILTEIESIGWDKLESINSTFTELKLKMCDSADRQHILTIKLGGNTPEFIAEFPRPFLSQGISTLKDVYNLFSQEAEQYQEFWQAMDELDSGCWILEPETPFLSDTYRKIAVTQNVSLKIDVEPKNPRSFPTITWFGSETGVFDFREKAIDRLEVWESNSPIHTNLERLLEINLPRKEDCQVSAETYQSTCCICYQERLEGQVPSCTCDNPQCGQSFHIFCLYEWLRSLIQSTRKQGNKVFGTCPYCEQPISCKPPDSN